MRADGRSWWAEGTAEYFSNVAYPDVNYEWRWIDDLDVASASKPITMLSYENFLFFQYLGNTVGNAAILDLIATLPTSSKAKGKDHADALAAFGDMETLFHDYAEQYLDGAIVDSSGVPVPVDPAWPKPHAVTGTDKAKVTIKSFTVIRGIFAFAEEPRFEVAHETTGGPGRFGVKAGDDGPWGNPPAEIDCGAPRTYKSVFTSIATAPPAAVVGFRFTASESDCQPTTSDPCLIGSWIVTDAQAFLNSLVAGAAASGGPVPVFENVEGRLVATFDGSRLTWEAEDIAITGTAQVQGMEVMTTVFFEGTAVSDYVVAEPGRLAWDNADVSGMAISANAMLDGTDLGTTPIDPADLALFGDNGMYSYTCGDEVLELAMETPDGTSAPIVLER